MLAWIKLRFEPKKTGEAATRWLALSTEGRFRRISAYGLLPQAADVSFRDALVRCTFLAES